MNIQYRGIKQYFGSYVVAAVLVMSVVSTGFGSSRASAIGCVTPLGADSGSNAGTVDAAYQQWKAKYVTSSGAGGDLRVQRSQSDNYDTVSEGIAYGMLFAVYNNDKSTFDGLWAYAGKHMNSNGVMNWKVAADGSIAGYNGATDADEDMAAALVAADTAWGGYRTAAVKQIDIIKRHEVEPGTNIMKPGDVWGGSNLLNPSYFAPSYYDLFQNFTGDNEWANVKAANYRVLQVAQNSSTGLVPDWSSSTGGATSGMSYDYSYDASRAPIRLAMGASWSCDTAASDLLKPFNELFAAKNLSQLASSYSLEGTANGTGDSTPTLAAAASAASVSKNDTYRSASWKALLNTPSTGYYPDSMKLFSLMVAGGTMINPLNLPQRQSVAATAPIDFQILGIDSAASTGKAADLSLSFVAPKQQDNLLVDVELYDKSGRKVAQQVYENQTLSTTAKNYRLSWTPDTTGEYVIKGGVFTAGWVQNVRWNDHAAAVTVSQPLTTQPIAPMPSPLANQGALPSDVSLPTSSDAAINIWWPGSVQPVTGIQPFKSVVNGKNVDDYDMYWQVDGGRLNAMDSIHDSAPHKESWVEVGTWSWSSDNLYTITFVAKNKSGTPMAQKSTVITVSK
ncbi:MAG: celA [Candidatus Saccharibacteria bacterium]|nr:celA [Candidatus Saccharibacteria bacterium]